MGGCSSSEHLWTCYAPFVVYADCLWTCYAPFVVYADCRQRDGRRKLGYVVNVLQERRHALIGHTVKEKRRKPASCLDLWTGKTNTMYSYIYHSMA